MGKVRRARGPERSGERGWVYFFEMTAFRARRERECVKAGSVGERVVFGMPATLEGVLGSCECDIGGCDVEGFQYSTIRRAAEKMRDWMIWSFIPLEGLEGEGSSWSSFCRAMASSRRTAINSVALRLLC